MPTGLTSTATTARKSTYCKRLDGLIPNTPLSATLQVQRPGVSRLFLGRRRPVEGVQRAVELEHIDARLSQEAKIRRLDVRLEEDNYLARRDASVLAPSCPAAHEGLGRAPGRGGDGRWDARETGPVRGLVRG